MVGNSKVAKRYAIALFELAQEEKSLDKVALDMAGIKASLDGSLELREFVRNPIFKEEERIAIVQKVFEKRAQPLVLKFLLFLIAKSRLSVLKEIAQAFEDAYLAHKNILRVTIQSARTIEPNQMKALTLKLKERLGKEILSEVIVDKKILGGFKIKTNNLVFDGSLKTQLDKFQESVITAI